MAPSDSYEVRIKVEGELDPVWWSGMFADIVVAAEPDGTTTLRGRLIDQAAVHGLLAAIRDMGLSLLSVETAVAQPRPEETKAG
jgi:hypothetical protein